MWLSRIPRRALVCVDDSLVSPPRDLAVVVFFSAHLNFDLTPASSHHFSYIATMSNTSATTDSSTLADSPPVMSGPWQSRVSEIMAASSAAAAEASSSENVPLTTYFTPPVECMDGLYTSSTRSFGTMTCTKAFTSSCFPSRFNTTKSGAVYSPGVCPHGYNIGRSLITIPASASAGTEPNPRACTQVVRHLLLPLQFQLLPRW